MFNSAYALAILITAIYGPPFKQSGPSPAKVTGYCKKEARLLDSFADKPRENAMRKTAGNKKSGNLTLGAKHFVYFTESTEKSNESLNLSLEIAE